MRHKGKDKVMTEDFRSRMEAKLICCKRNVLKCEGQGKWRGKSYPWKSGNVISELVQIDG